MQVDKILFQDEEVSQKQQPKESLLRVSQISKSTRVKCFQVEADKKLISSASHSTGVMMSLCPIRGFLEML